MLSTSLVSVVLLIVWGAFYLFMREKMFTSKMYFALLLLMGSAGLLFNPLPLMGLQPEFYRLGNVILFALLMGFTVIPWLKVDKLFGKGVAVSIKEDAISRIKSTNIFLIILSLYSIVYSFPYAVTATIMGADDVRTLIADDYMMPKTFFTTLAVGFASLAPINVLMFYLSLLDKRLKKYSVWLAISSTAIMVTNAASAARDTFIFIPLTYVCFYILFKGSIEEKAKKNIKKIGIVALLLLLFVLGGITLDRFFNDRGSEKESLLLYGTWGYFYQQPYVFDHILDYSKSFYGFERRLQFLDGAFGIHGTEYVATYADRMDYMFGSMYAEFYQINGYGTLLVGFLLYILVFYTILSSHYKKKNYFALLMSFSVYFIFTISGMFYFRYGGNDSEFLFYMSILLITFFVPNFLTIRKN